MPAVAYTFDTLAAAKDLEAAGVEREQAEAIVALHVRSGEQLATKRDLDPLATKAFVFAGGDRDRARQTPRSRSALVKLL